MKIKIIIIIIIVTNTKQFDNARPLKYKHY